VVAEAAPQDDVPEVELLIRHWRLAVLDVRRLYQIDLTDPAYRQLPWSRVRPFLLGLLTEPSSQVYNAVWR